jgi:Spy/CpxP family protein refolding chaperone
MKRRVLLTLFSAVILIGLLIAGTWYCLGWMTRKQMAQGDLFNSATWQATLNLTTEQEIRIKPLEQELKKDLAPLDIDVMKNQMELCRLMMTPGHLDRNAISRLSGRIGDLQRKREERVIDHLVVLRTVLDERQQKQLFTTLMNDLCKGCRTATGNQMDHCGMCDMR